jgi:phosphate starvation-inducible PhoH-like protein
MIDRKGVPLNMARSGSSILTWRYSLPRTVKVAKRANRENPRINRRQERNLHILSSPDTERCKRVQPIPRSLAQETYLEALYDDTKYIVIATGPAGTGKSLLATQCAIKMLQEGSIKHIVITRPAVGVDQEEHGHLPGTIIEKLAPWVQPIIDIFREHYSVPAITKLIETGVVEFVPIAFVRGRTFKNTVVIFDEAQNSLPTAMKVVLTRIGEGTRIFITGDMEQHDRGRVMNGLRDFINRLKDTSTTHIIHCEFSMKDIERHPCVAEVLELYAKV